MNIGVHSLQQQWLLFLPSLGIHHRSLINSRCNFHHPSQRYRLLPLASSSSSPSISRYPEQLLDSKTEQRMKRIAGIDQDELVDPKQLADPDSCFCEFQGVHIHHKVYNPQSQDYDSLQSQSHNQTLSQLPLQTKKTGFPMILLHGFGASVYSWDRVMKRLAELTNSKVLSFDRPAFGLTSREERPFKHLPTGSKDKEVKPLNPYSMAFSVLVTLYFIESLAAEKVILVGHSAGSLVAVNSYFEAPERVAALILVAPAILAPLYISKVLKRNEQAETDRADSNYSGISNFFRSLLKFIKSITQSIMQKIKGITNMVNSLYKKVLAAILRSTFAVILIRTVIDKFGIAAIKNAWYDAKEVTEQVLHGYTKPLRVKGWDRALAEFTAAMLADPESETQIPLAERLHKISCPVLIVTGDTDRLVPSWNAERLSKAIPGSTLEVIKNCGHLPQEEKVEDFVSVVKKFLQRVYDVSEEQQHLQPV